MKNTFGNSVTATLFGESHGHSVGAVLDGIPAGIKIDTDLIDLFLKRRKPSGKISTKRVEPDNYKIVSGVKDGITCGTPICIIIDNENINSSDYKEFHTVPRPSHADYTARIKYDGFEDYRGGGHFSGRLTAPLVIAGAIAISVLKMKNINLATHIKNLHGISDRDFNNLEEDFEFLKTADYPVLDSKAKLDMIKETEAAADDGDSIGGVLETVITGVPTGLGEPFFDSAESLISHAVFSVPAVKGIEFGLGFDFKDKKGSEANDEFFTDGKSVFTKTNNNGGILGGITSGMPIVFKTAVKPTPSIFKTQNSVNLNTKENTQISICGRHDPAVIHRAAVVIESVAALALLDLLSMFYGTKGLGKN